MSNKPDVSFTPLQEMMIQEAANAVWNEIAYDLIQSVAENEEQDENDVQIPRSEVVELVLDAGRIDHFLRRNKYFTPSFAAKWEEASYQQRINIVTGAFRYETYGL